jgi:hypothetical protein
MTRLSRSDVRRFAIAGILAVGWTVAAAVYATASPAQEDPDVYDMQHSKRYERQVEMLGGKATVMANEMTEWFAGIWQGTRLAYTIAVLTIAVACAYYLWDRALRSPRDRAD